jgi:hypothetical protein
MRHPTRTVAQELSRFATVAHGIVTRGELLGAGLSSSQIIRRLRTGTLIREYPGVYRVGHRAPSLAATYLAAVKACGPGAALCGRAAGYLLGLIKGSPPAPEVLTTTERRIPGLVTRRTRRFERRDIILWKRIPVTTVARTLVDLAAVLREADLARAVHEAGVRHDIKPARVEAVLSRRPRTRGAATLRRVLRGDVRVTLSVLESRFLELLRENGLPLPITNRRAGGRFVDCRWPDLTLTVELDSYTFHSSRHAWEQDRRREREAYARGDDFRRYTYGDVCEEPRLMLRELRPLLSRKRPT